MELNIDSILSESASSRILGPVDAMQVARERATATKSIAFDYRVFEDVRDVLLERKVMELASVHRTLLKSLCDVGLAEQSGAGWYVNGQESRRYLTGGWLEEYVALAVAEVGADEVLTGQKVSWRVGNFVGENEIDVLARFGSRLFMCSCKALKSALLPDDVRTRERLMHALHEADNLLDHFAPSGGMVALAVTTDLMDERARLVRYQQLHGKAAILGVSLMTLEHMPWPEIVRRLRLIVAGAHVTV